MGFSAPIGMGTRMGGVTGDGVNESKREQTHQISPFTAWLPYLFVALLLVLTRLDALPFAALLKIIEICSTWVDSFKTTAKASVALVFTVPMVQVFLNSDGGVAGYDKMPIVLAEGIASLAGSAYPLFAPLVGGFGAFVAGSNTISNMMFSLFQFDVGIRIGVDATWMVALQAVGGAAGNVICVHNILAALAVVGLTGREEMLSEKRCSCLPTTR